METQKHPFEAAGLGLAPFRFVGFSAGNFYQACPGAPRQVGGSCDYCGTGIVNFCFIRSADGKSFKVGTDCVLKTHDRGLKKEMGEARRADKAEKRAEKRRVIEVKRSAEVKAVLVKTLEENTKLAGYMALADKHHVLADLKIKLERWGVLSPAQIKLADDIVEQLKKREEEDKLPRVPVVAGKRSVIGVIISTRSQDSDYGVQYKMLVKLSTGEKVWGSIPSAILRTADAISQLRQKNVAFTATFEVSDRDPCFGFFKRPRNACIA